MRDGTGTQKLSGQVAVSRYNPNMYRVAAIVLLIMLAGLQYRLWVGDGSLAQVYHLESMRGQIAKVNARHRARNEAMQAQIENLKSGLGASEARARAEMGMIKPDETFFLTVPGKESAPAQTTEDASGRSANAG